MLSVLIPIYNYDCRDLFNSLSRQIYEGSYTAEIIAIDDGSHPDFHALHEPLDLPYFRYIRKTNNIGRSAIRNLLAKEARYDNLLLLDCDSAIQDDYISSYITRLPISEKQVICGGRVYADNPPQNPALRLHWLYGAKRESVSQVFQSNNFLITKKLFQQIGFDETLTNYGHEDTLFGAQLNLKHADLTFINNPVEHLGLEQSVIFLRKQQEAVKNLHKITRENEDIESQLFELTKRIKKYRLSGVVRKYCQQRMNYWLTNLQGHSPKLSSLDWYKLGLLLEEQKRDKIKKVSIRSTPFVTQLGLSFFGNRFFIKDIISLTIENT